MMTPKEKAIELVDKYYLICQEFTEEIQCSIQAKQCALVAVDEMIEECTEGYSYSDYRRNYWQQVKHELNKSE